MPLTQHETVTKSMSWYEFSAHLILSMVILKMVIIPFDCGSKKQQQSKYKNF